MTVEAADARPLLALTPGDPAGIGPELVLAALADEELTRAARLLVVGDAAHLAARAKRIGTDFDAPAVESAAALGAGTRATGCLAGSSSAPDEDVLGTIDAAAGKAALDWIRSAASLALAGDVDGIVTGPINKQAIKRAGAKQEGHTELLGDLARAKPVMMLVGGGLRVAIVTRHLALRDVPRQLSAGEIGRTVRVVGESLARDFGIDAPRIAVLALNPHASDGGRFGDEERTLIEPAIKAARSNAFTVEGPLVPDVAFWNALHGSHDAVVAMYHDQGLIALKTIAFDTGVNVTLGLPIVRTSPDHGTAYEIAGKGQADARSFAAAVRLAVDIVANRRKTPAR
jgi:4-hydroxythreonine-4-phosphate dehydrogenase